MQTCQGIANVYYHKNSDRATERMQVLLLLSSFSKPLTPQTNGQRPVPKAVYACIIGTCPCSKNPLIWTEEEEPVHFPTNIQRSKPRWTLHALYIYIQYTFRVLFLHHQILLVCILAIHNGPGYPFLIDLFGRWKLLYFFGYLERERVKV